MALPLEEGPQATELYGCPATASDSAKGTVEWRFAHLEEREKMADKNESAQAQNKGEMPIREVIRLIGLVNYQEGSVVSRTIVKRATGTLTLFAFDEGQGLSEHTAAFDALALLLEGEAEITVSGKPLRTSAGEAVLLPANQPHSLKALSRFKMLLTMIRS